MSKTWSRRGLHIIIDGLKRFLKFIDKDNRLLLCVPKVRRTRPIIPTLNKNEESALWHVIDSELVAPRDRAIILLSMLTGLRASDIVTLEIKDIDWSNDTISVIQREFQYKLFHHCWDIQILIQQKFISRQTTKNCLVAACRFQQSSRRHADEKEFDKQYRSSD